MKTIITGATGQLGTLILENLLEKLPAGQLVAGIRNPEKAAHLQKLGLELRIADYDDEGTLEGAFHGVTRLLLISSPHPEDNVRLEQHKRVIQAAQEAGVKHILYTGFAFSGRNGAENVHTLTEQAIRETGLQYTFLRNALYMDFVNVLGLAEAVNSGVLATAPGAWRFNAVTRSDLALAAAAIIADKGEDSHSYELTASQTWNFTDLAAALSEQAGKPVVHCEDPGIKHWIYGFLAAIDTVSTTDELERWMGRPVTPLSESIIPFAGL